MRDIAESLLHVAAAGCDAVLVTIVGNSGSAPRHVGSQMLVSAAGLICGTVGGGAIEGHALEAARAMVGEGACRVENLALKKNLGMACGGAAILLYTPVDPRDGQLGQLAGELLRCIDDRIPSYLLLTCADGVISPGCGVALVDEGGAVIAGSYDVRDSYAECLGPAMDTDLGGGWEVEQGRWKGGDLKSEPRTDPNSDPGADPEADLSDSRESGLGQGAVIGDVFAMPVAVRPRAVVFGGGHVGVATIEALSRVGFSCTLFECRPEFALAQRVPAAREIIVGDYENIAASLALDARDYVLIMTHTHHFDGAVLEQVLRCPLAYAGCIGSRRKIAGVRDRLRASGIPEAVIDGVHMPIGLDIKAETPEEIAVSIAAECIRHRATQAGK